VIPLTNSSIPVHKPFYLYTELYCLETRDGKYQVSTTYEVYNKERMKKEIVDIMFESWSGERNIAY